MEEQTKKNLFSIQAVCEKVPNVATLSDNIVRVVANDTVRRKMVQ